MYPPISDYGIIGDAHTAALISAKGSIDWLCLPHFDSPAVFLRLLDDAKGGYCAVEPTERYTTTRSYLEGTNILQTKFKTAGGALSVTDFMPIRQHPGGHAAGQDVATEHRIVRLIQCTPRLSRVHHHNQTNVFFRDRTNRDQVLGQRHCRFQGQERSIAGAVSHPTYRWRTRSFGRSERAAGLGSGLDFHATPNDFGY